MEFFGFGGEDVEEEFVVDLEDHARAQAARGDEDPARLHDVFDTIAKTAREEGFDDIAEWFETLAKAEKSHAGRFKKMLDVLKA